MDIPVVKQGQFITVDTTIKSTDVMYIDEMNGDLGDANRKVYLAIKERPNSNDPKDPLIPMNLNGRDVRFQGHDADGMYKRISLATKIINAKAGLVEMTLPRQLYMAVGSYKNAEFEVYEVNGDTNVSTVPVGLEVYDNLVHMSVGENKVYIDEAEKLIKDLEKMTGESLDEFRATLNKMNANVDDALTSIKTLENLVEAWKQLVKDNGVAEKAADNIMAGKNTFLEFVNGFTTGNYITSYGANEPVQDLNDVSDLRAMRSFTTKHEYFSSNKTLNNPMPGDLFYLISEKVSTQSVFQRAIRLDNNGYGIIMMRRITNLASGTTEVGTWGKAAEWGSPWKSLLPYLNKDFIAGVVSPMYKIVGDEVRFRGVVTPKVTLKNENTGNGKIWVLFDNLPFKFSPGQTVPCQASGKNMYASVTQVPRQVQLQKHQNGGIWSDIAAGGQISVKAHYDIEE